MWNKGEVIDELQITMKTGTKTINKQNFFLSYLVVIPSFCEKPGKKSFACLLSN